MKFTEYHLLTIRIINAKRNHQQLHVDSPTDSSVISQFALGFFASELCKSSTSLLEIRYISPSKNQGLRTDLQNISLIRQLDSPPPPSAYRKHPESADSFMYRNFLHCQHALICQPEEKRKGRNISLLSLSVIGIKLNYSWTIN